jgi:hypothetical protein
MNISKLKQFVSRYDIQLILLSAVLVRIIRLPHVFYGALGEMFRDLIVVYDFLHGGAWPLLGPGASVGGFSFGAAYYYLLAPFVYLFNFLPVGAVVASVVFSCGAVGLLYLVLRRWFVERYVAILAAALAAFSVFDIQFAAYASNTNFLPFFLLLAFYCLTRMLEGERNWWLAAGLGMAGGVAMQLHATVLFILPLTLVGVAFGLRLKFDWKKCFAVLVAFLFTYTPYLFFEMQSGFANFRRLLQVGQHSFSYLPQTAAGVSVLGFWADVFVVNVSYFNLFQSSRFWYFVVLVALLVYALWFLGSRKSFVNSPHLPISRAGRAILISWLAVGTLTFLFYAKPAASFYFLALWPMPVIFLAWLAAYVKQGSRPLFLGLLTVYFFVQAVQLVFFYGQVTNPRYEYGSYRNMFIKIASDAGSVRARVVYSGEDTNTFLYYLRLSGLKDQLSNSGASLVYLVFDSPEQAELSLKFSACQPLGVPSPQFTILKCQKTLVGKL